MPGPNDLVSPLKPSLFKTDEGRILVAALLLVAACVTALGMGLFRDDVYAQELLGMGATNVVFGRAAGLSFGFAAGLPNWIVVGANGLIETIQVMLVYPLFVLSWRSLLEIRALNKFMLRTRRAAERHEKKIQRFGIPGLFVFVLIPFWMTGPVIGSVIGFFLGLRAWVNLVVVLSGTWLAVFGWAWVLRKLQRQAEVLGTYVPFTIVVAVIVLILLARWLHHAGRNAKDGRS